MTTLYARSWWALILRGICGVLFGVLAFIWPGITLSVLVILFGAYAFVDGLINLIGAVRAIEAHERWAPLIVEGIFGILAGILTVFWPGITLIFLIYLIAIWSFVTGFLEIAAAMRLRRYVANEWILVVSGVASIIFGALLLFFPIAGALVIAWWVGAYAFIFGIMMIALGIRLRPLTRTHGPAHPLPAH